MGYCKDIHDMTNNMFQHYVVTGKYVRSNKKFRLVYEKWSTADRINLWNGRVWGVRHDGTRKLLKTVWN